MNRSVYKIIADLNLRYFMITNKDYWKRLTVFKRINLFKQGLKS